MRQYGVKRMSVIIPESLSRGAGRFDCAAVIIGRDGVKGDTLKICSGKSGAVVASAGAGCRAAIVMAGAEGRAAGDRAGAGGRAVKGAGCRASKSAGGCTLITVSGMRVTGERTSGALNTNSLVLVGSAVEGESKATGRLRGAWWGVGTGIVGLSTTMGAWGVASHLENMLVSAWADAGGTGTRCMTSRRRITDSMSPLHEWTISGMLTSGPRGITGRSRSLINRTTWK